MSLNQVPNDHHGLFLNGGQRVVKIYFHAQFQAPSLKNDRVMSILNQKSHTLTYLSYCVTLEYSSKSVDLANL